LHWLQKARLTSLVKAITEDAFKQTKRDIDDYMHTFWPQKTGELVKNAVVHLMRNQWYNIAETATLTLGSEFVYLQYLQGMSAWMATKGKKVHWTNPLTAMIEDDILGHTWEYAATRLAMNLNAGYSAYNLQWLFGRGRIPKAVLVNYQQTTPGRKAWEREVEAYRGWYKPLEVYL
jgi:hypothetical protein